jgi:hypothetical protein
MHLSPIELRAEDYYLIRTKQLDDKHRKNLEMEWLGKKVFNQNLLSGDSMASIK